MVARRRLSPGGSYGRAQVLVNWVQDNWQHFDSWCCVRNIDPIDLPAYRLCNLALVVIKEDLHDDDPDVTAQQLENLDKVLLGCDEINHPLMRLGVTYSGKAVVKRVVREEETQASPTPESRHKYIPPWYKGEEAAYQSAKIAQAGISSLPKMQG